MIEKSKILKYLTQEIKTIEITYNNFSWMEYMRRGLMEKIDTLENIKNLIESGYFDSTEASKMLNLRRLKNETGSSI